MILITGTPKNGSLYTSQLLSKCGLELGTEEATRSGVVNWKHAIFHRHFDTVIHQVREPLACIGSLQAIPMDYVDMIAKHIDIDRTKPALYQAGAIYLFWNLMCQGKSKYTYKVESMPTIWNELSSKLGLVCEMPILPTNINTNSDSVKISYDDIKDCSVELYDRIRWYAETVGYL